MKNRQPVQVVALLAGAAFLLVGVLGFVPGITTGFADLSFAGRQSEAHLLGLFQVSVLHNVVHLLFGVAGLAAARSVAGARGFLVDQGSPANFVPVNSADNLLHLGLGLGMLAAGLALAKAGSSPTSPAHRR